MDITFIVWYLAGFTTGVIVMAIVKGYLDYEKRFHNCQTEDC